MRRPRAAAQPKGQEESTSLFPSLLRAASILASLAPLPGATAAHVSTDQLRKSLGTFEKELGGWATVFSGEELGEDDLPSAFTGLSVGDGKRKGKKKKHVEEDSVVAKEEASDPAEWTALYREVIMRGLWVIEQLQAGLVLDQTRAAVEGKEDKEKKDVKGKGREVEPQKPLVLGTKDMQHIRTLLTLIFQHLTKLLSDRLALAAPDTTSITRTSTTPTSVSTVATPSPASPVTPSQASSPNTNGLRFYPPPAPVLRLLHRLFSLIYTELPQPPPKPLSWDAQILARTALPLPAPTYRPQHTHISNIIFNRNSGALLAACVVLGWAPQEAGIFPGEGKQGEEEQEVLREWTRRLLYTIPTSQGLVILGLLHSASPLPNQLLPSYALLQLKDFLCALILRPDGPRALMDVVLGEKGPQTIDSSTATKLDHVSLTLSAVPRQFTPRSYYCILLPRLMLLIRPPPGCELPAPVPTSHVRAAAGTIARMIRQQRGICMTLLARNVLAPFFPPTHAYSKDWPAHLPRPQALHALQALSILLANVDPSPVLWSVLLGEILPPLWGLYEFLSTQPTADPVLRELAQGLIEGWARLVGDDVAVSGWIGIVQCWKGWGYGEGGKWEWALGPEGPFVRALEGKEEDVNVLQVHPDPLTVVAVLKKVARKEVNAELFVKMLDLYGEEHGKNGDTADSMLYLQYVLAMADSLGHMILSKPEHVLSFILHALESTVKPVIESKETLGSGSSPWKVVGDSDDEDAGQDEGDGEDDGGDTMARTAVTLLLAVLEAKESFPPFALPMLNSIYQHLDTLSSHPTLSQSAREARLVLAARRAGAMRPQAKEEDEVREKALEKYQEALRLVQDQLLPVRAHGLTLLRQLVTPTQPTAPEELALDPALIPGILDVFLLSVQDEDSYVYLNAVHGLSAMLQGPAEGKYEMGRLVLRRLVELYVLGLGLGLGLESGRMSMSTAEVDKRLRIGEAISQGVAALGPGVGKYVELIEPSMLLVTRTPAYPTVLRGSSLSILSQCVTSAPLSLLPFYPDLLSCLLDLLSLETVAQGSKAAKDGEAQALKRQREDGKLPDPSDLDPAAQDPKLPAFRRSAAYLLVTLLRQAAEGGFVDNVLDMEGRKRVVGVLRWVGDVDVDIQMRGKAKEGLGIMDGVVRSKLGLAG
ncbi:hypothetical protein DACRYDRAFT_113279 [Dacryopinax primogenitus]|uniref:RNA polymerase II assembly factor Rtp1 C-terminal domain-containing protein n=1 Tax=Dacryopinax primogenitus (strain DJM 731) TaxID=1858805 RepID=M5GD57_DACPD|nr:uncharacterized protein DACRYDRAFT_113279 [Dacryopinax primogenitus]EJU06615.1 hypothetical protein DACRYDRAFT_113279 [Dacryopinax primogenitus]